MSKRKVQFSDDGPSVEQGEPESKRLTAKHSIDSDEEPEDVDNNLETNVLKEDDIEGQEEDTIRSYGDIKITPFNLKEEMEEGHFDAEGNYIPDKDQDAVQDEWLESVDWSKVKEKEGETEMATDEPDELEEMTKFDKIKAVKQIVKLLKPGENVLKALRRLGGQSKKLDRKKGKKDAKIDNKELDEETVKENRENLLRLTELADLLLQQGDFEIYNKTYEKLCYEIKSEEEQFQDADEDDELEAAFSSKAGKDKNQSVQAEDKPSSDVDEVMWLYKWEDKEEAEVYGPYKNSCMLSWNEQGFFKDGVFCRKNTAEGSFYSSKRMDFELYC